MITYDPREDPQRTMYRVIFWLTLILNSVLFLWSLAASYFDFNSSWTPYPMAALSFLTIINVGFYGDWAMNRDVKADTYRFMVIQYFLSGLTLAVGCLAFVQIEQGKAFIADNWAVMSQEVIPFTTQLAQTRTFELLQSGLAWVGWFSALVALPQMQRAFELLDERHARFALNPWRVLLPQLVMLTLLAALTIAAGSDAAYVATYGHGADESALLFTIVTAALVLVGVVIAVLAAWSLGTHHTTYTIVWVTFGVLSVFAVFGGSFVSAQASDVEDFVFPRWDQLRVFVPTRYQDNSANTYVRDAEALLRYAGLGGVLLFLFSLLLVTTACHSAFLLMALAPSAEAGPDAIHHAAKSLRDIVSGETGAASSAGAALSPSNEAAGYYGTLAGSAGEVGSGLKSDGGVGGSASSSSSSSSARRGSRSSGAGGDDDQDDDAEEGLDEIDIVDSDEEDDAGRASVAGSQTQEHRGSFSGSSFNGGIVGGPRSVASSSVYGGYDRTALPNRKDYQMPSWADYAQISSNQLRRELGRRPSCLVAAALVAIAVIVGVSVGLVEVGQAARCGALARDEAFTSSFMAQLPVREYTQFFLMHKFPRGRVRFSAYPGYDDPGRDFLNVTVRTWSLDGAKVWSQQRLRTAIASNFTIDPPRVDVDMILTAEELAAAASSCDTAEIIISAPQAPVDFGVVGAEEVRRGDTRSQRLRSLADEAAAAVAGVPVSAVRDEYVAQPRFDLFASGAESLPPRATLKTHPDEFAQEIRRQDDVRTAAAAEPEAALEELLARLEDPTALPALPPAVVMGSPMAAGHGPYGPAMRKSERPVRIGPANGRSGHYLSTRDDFELELNRRGVQMLRDKRAEAKWQWPNEPEVRRARTAADLRSWTKVLAARDEAKAAVEQAEEQQQQGGGGEAAVSEAKAVLVAVEEKLAQMRLQAAEYASYCSVFVATESAYVHVESHLNFFPSSFDRVIIDTTDGPVVMDDTLIVPLPDEVVEPAVIISTKTGDVNVSSMVGPGVTVTSESGDLYMLGVAGVKLTFFPTAGLLGQGDVVLKTGGEGKLTITEGLGGVRFNATTEDGLLLVTNSAGAVGKDLLFEALGEADIWFTTMILAGGNVTTIRTNGGTVHVNVIYANYVSVDCPVGGDAALVELFLGILAPKDKFDPPLELDYAHPALYSNNPKGSISLTGVGGAPTPSCPQAGPGTFTSNIIVDLRTEENPINVQINGGGINAPYSIETQHGVETMNIEGREAPTSGTLGVVTKTQPSSGYFRASATYGDITVVELDNSIPDLSSIGIVI